MAMCLIVWNVALGASRPQLVLLRAPNVVEAPFLTSLGPPPALAANGILLLGQSRVIVSQIHVQWMHRVTGVIIRRPSKPVSVAMDLRVVIVLMAAMTWVV